MIKSIVPILFFFLIGCASTYEQKQPTVAGTMVIYEGKLAIIFPNKTHQLSFEHVADPFAFQSRTEVRGLLGILAATIWINEKKVHFANHLQRKFYESENSKTALNAWFNREIDPNIFFLVMEKRIPSGWTCIRNSEGALENCSSGPTRVQFFPVSEEKQKVYVIAPEFEVRFVYDVPPRFERIDNKLFVPVSHRDYQIFTQP